MTHTPEGVADLLCDECELKCKIEQLAREIFKQYGYRMVQTPTFEYFDVYDAATATKAETMFKFFDSDGRMLSLRPDLTTAVARLAATKLTDAKLPLKLFYQGSAFRNEENFSQARQREFTQLGVELIGDKSPEADAEVIEIAIETLRKAGISRFQIDLGQVEFFKALIEQAGLDEAQANTIREMIDGKDFIGIEGALAACRLEPEMREIFLELPTMFGGIEVAEAALRRKGLHTRARHALENLLQVYELLKKRGLEQYVSIDLGMVPNLDYYTGVIVKGFTYGVGFPICTGGRYDNLTAKFGRQLPATGIAIGVERVMSALTEKAPAAVPGRAEYLTVALAKGRLAELSVDLFEKIGFDVQELKEKSRKLIFTDEAHKTKFILVKASDVPTYVEYGAADVGVVGKDTLLEEGKNLYEVLDLGFGACKMAVAGPPEMQGRLEGRNMLRVASKYPAIAQEYFHKMKGQAVDIIKLNGSVELGPLVGLSEVIVDIVESGKTLRENGLTVLEEVCPLSARLVVNRVSMKLERERIVSIIRKMKEALA